MTHALWVPSLRSKSTSRKSVTWRLASIFKPSPCLAKISLIYWLVFSTCLAFRELTLRRSSR